MQDGKKNSSEVTSPKWIICDLDGTLCDSKERAHFIDKKEWDAFHSAGCFAEPIEQSIMVLRAMLQHKVVERVCIITGRDEKYLQPTLDWLCDYGIHPDLIYMRKSKDYRPDIDMKGDFLKKLYKDASITKKDIFVVFEDRKKMVDWWRMMGFVCFQVAEGDY